MRMEREALARIREEVHRLETGMPFDVDRPISQQLDSLDLLTLLAAFEDAGLGIDVDVFDSDTTARVLARTMVVR